MKSVSEMSHSGQTQPTAQAATVAQKTNEAVVEVLVLVTTGVQVCALTSGRSCI